MISILILFTVPLFVCVAPLAYVAKVHGREATQRLVWPLVWLSVAVFWGCVAALVLGRLAG